jgi:hypothetical protein
MNSTNSYIYDTRRVETLSLFSQEIRAVKRSVPRLKKAKRAEIEIGLFEHVRYIQSVDLVRLHYNNT